MREICSSWQRNWLVIDLFSAITVDFRLKLGQNRENRIIFQTTSRCTRCLEDPQTQFHETSESSFGSLQSNYCTSESLRAAIVVKTFRR